MIKETNKTKINNSDDLIEIIRNESRNMDFEEYAQATGLDREFIFRILKGDIEEVDEETLKKLYIKH